MIVREPEQRYGSRRSVRVFPGHGSRRIEGVRAIAEQGEVGADRGGPGSGVEFAPLGPESAHWEGTRAAFLGEIAAARTFGFRSQAADLRARGRAAFVNPRSVIVLEDDGHVLPPGLPPRPGELGRHKLLDLLGDLYLYGGPPRGRIDATRPGHRNNHLALREALASGLLETRLGMHVP